MAKGNSFLYGLLLALFFNVTLTAQITNPVQVWDMRYGGDNRDTDLNTIRTADNGFLITASTLSAISGNKTIPNQGNDDWWVIKTDQDGNIQWQFGFGGVAEEGFEGGAIQTADGNYVLAGRTRSGATGDITSPALGGNDFLIIKIDASGTGVLWQTRVGGMGDDVIYDVIETSDGGIIAGGYTGSINIPGNPPMGSLDGYLVKLDANGNILWQRTQGGSGFESWDELVPDNAGGVFAGGYSASTDLSVASKGSFDFWLMQVDDQGNTIWENTYGGTGVDAVRAIERTIDGGIILGGQSNSNASGDKSEDGRGQDDMWLVRTDANGNLLWEKTMGGDGFDWAQSIQALSDGSFVFGGFSNSTPSGDKMVENINGSLDVWFMQIDDNANPGWQGLFGGNLDEAVVDIPYFDEAANEVYIAGVTISDLGYYIGTGNYGTDSDLWFTKFRLNTIQNEQTEACLNSPAMLPIDNSVLGKAYQFRNTDGTPNGQQVVGTGGQIELTSDPISTADTLSVFVTSQLSDGSILEEYIGDVLVGLNAELDAALNTTISYQSDICYNRMAKVWVHSSEAGVTYQLVDDQGTVYGERMGNGNKIHVKTGKLKESVNLKLKLIGQSCTAFHPEEININVADKITARMEFDRDQLFTDIPIEFTSSQDTDIVKWTWIFDYRVRKTGQTVTHKFKRPGLHIVKLRVENQAGCKKQIIRKIYVKDRVFLGAPGVFNPNTDDPFSVRLRHVTHEHLTILNHYGRPVYSGRNSWDGTKRGRLVREGKYIYYIRARKKDGTLFMKRGSFYLRH